MFRVIKATVTGGLVFLLPLLVLAMLIGKALQVAREITGPLADALGVEAAFGMLAVDVLAAVLLLAFCVAAGFAAQTALANRIVGSLEERVLKPIPAYALLKARAHTLMTPETMRAMTPVLVRFDDSWQLAFCIDQQKSDHLSVLYLPGAPDVWSGSICIVTRDRLQPLDMTMKEASELLRRLGLDATPKLTEAIEPASR